MMASALVVGLTLVGCTKKQQSDEQGKGELEVPTFAKAVKPAFLTGVADTAEYTGSFIVWNPTVTKEQVAEVILASRKYSQTYATQLTFERDRILPAERAIVLLKTELQKAQTEKNLSLLAVRSTAASRWFDDQLADPSFAGLDSMDRTQAQAVFEAICESALWKMATSTSFVLAKYLSVPTPLALCRGVYETKGLLRPEAAACSPATSAEGKNYFPCFWTEGVAKTALFQRYGARLPEMLSIDVLALEQGIATNVSFWEKVLRQMSVTIGDRVVSFKIDGQTISAAATFATAPVDMILSKSIGTGLTAANAANPSYADALGLISVKRTDRDVAAIPVADKLRERIRIFWTQLNDSKLNDALLVREPGIAVVPSSGTTADQTPYLAIFEGTDPLADQKVAEVEAALAVKYQEKVLLDAEGGSLGEGQNCALLPDNLSCKTRLAQEAQVAAVQADGVGLAIATGTELVVHRSLNQALSVVLTFSSRDTKVKQLRVCLDGVLATVVDRDVCTWPARLMQKDDVPVELIEKVDVSMDRDTGKLSFGFDPLDFGALGLTPKERPPGDLDFNLIDVGRWHGKRISLELYPAELDEVMAIYSGSGKVKDEQESLSTTISLTSVIRKD